MWYKLMILGWVALSISLPTKSELLAQDRESSAWTIARLKYSGGGDWYNDPSAIPNLARFMNANTGVRIREDETKISVMDERLFSFPVLFLTGHGQVSFTEREAERLRLYLESGGFLYADDDYGLDGSFRLAMKQVFPDRDWIELPFSHGIHSIHFRFEDGLPKIHEHDDKPPRGFGILDDNDRLMVFYTYETNLSDGWADPDVHGDPEEKRQQALKMGTNIMIWAILH
jgi:hypothetical protein